MLRSAFAAAGITDAHIVDDSFDEVPGVGLEDAAIQTFLSSLEEEQFDEVAAIVGLAGGNEDSIIEKLRTQEGAASLFKQKAKFGGAADELFREFANVIGGERDRLTALISALEGFGIKVHKFGRDYAVGSEPAPQMLFVDLKLREDQIRIQDPIAVVRAMQKHYGAADPLVFLMSAQEGSLEANRDGFRKGTGLFSSQFEDIPKRHFDRANLLNRFLAHHIEVYPKIVALQRHAKSWQQTMKAAQEKLDATLRELDFADYFVLGNSATADGIPLGSYVTDLLLEYIAHEIEGTSGIGSFAKELNSWSLKDFTRSRFNVVSAVADIFAANVLHSPARLAWEGGCSLGPDNGVLTLGDVFFYKAEVNSNKIDSALVVLQPACDLVRPENRAKIGATILVCYGDVSPFSGTSPLQADDGLDPVILEYPREGSARHVIRWEKKRPCYWSYDELKRLKSKSSDWVHVGRLRPLYALQLQRAITANLSRVGTQRRPHPYVAYGVQILVAKDKKWQTLLDAGGDSAAGAIADDKGAHKKTFILNDSFLRKALARLDDWQSRNEQQPAVTRMQQLLASSDATKRLMYCAADLSGDQVTRILYPLEAVPGIADELKQLVVFAVQRNEDAAYNPSKTVSDNEQAAIVFKFVRITP